MESLDRQAFANVDEKGFVPEDVRNAFFRKLRMKTENRTCFECSARNPTWNSLSFGVYLCLECSGEHRRKGVHISYVRSVELDQFRPDQMVQMALGGNGKAWTYFKQHSMGKTSDTGRAVDYTSKIAVRYKEQLERETREACLKLKIERKGSTQVSSSADPIEEAPEVAAPVPTAEPEATKSKAPLVTTAKAKATPSAPTTVVLRRTSAAESNSAPTPTAAASASPTSAPDAPVQRKSTGFAGSKHMAKELDFDFDFDELESEASKPKPAPVSAPAPKPAPVPTPSPAKPVAAAPAPAAMDGNRLQQDAKFTSKKAISSDDFFNDLEVDTAVQRMEREQRYAKMSGSGAISSAAFFNEDSNEDDEFGGPDWKVGLSKGAEMLTTYLNKVRD